MMVLLYFYITIFSFYFILLTLVSLRSERKIRDKYIANEIKFNVIVYATGKVKTLDNLIKQLKHQNYNNNKVSIYCIIDKVEDVNEVALQSDLEVKLIKYDNLEPVGKSQAYSIVAEKLLEFDDSAAFIFLDSKYYVNDDFLTNANYYMKNNNVVCPIIEYINEDRKLSLGEKIKLVYSRYYYNFLCVSRSKLNLTNLINTECLIIKSEIIRNLNNFDFNDKISELKFTLDLLKKGEKVVYKKDVIVYTDVNNFDKRTPSLSKRIEIFKKQIFEKSNFVVKEYLFSNLAPNILTYLIANYIIFNHVCKFPFIVNYSTVLTMIIIMFLSFLLSLSSINLYFKEYVYIAMYPLYSIRDLFLNLPPVRGVINFIKNKNRKRNVEKLFTNIIVNNGTRDITCQLELISEDGLASARFINRNKSYITKNQHLRMIDAIQELTLKLKEYGLTLKICQNCMFYQSIIDGSTNMVKGKCSCKFPGRVEGDEIQTLVWNTCPMFEKQNVISMFN